MMPIVQNWTMRNKNMTIRRGRNLMLLEKGSTGRENNQLSHPLYRADIDGMRAIAVFSVICFHAFPNMMPSGFIGVDIFFVISGFLISTIIFENVRNERFSFIEFYSRRIKRIFPALIILLTTCIVFGWFSLLADEYKQLGKHIASGAGFVSNFVLWGESGYFDRSAEIKPLLHLWTLGVEEQFYIIWPLMVWVGWKAKISPLLITIALTVVSFGLNIFGATADPVGTFYSPHTRIWEFGLGGLVAWIMGCGKKTPNNLIKVLNELLSISGVILLIIGMLLITKASLYPGWLALYPVLGTVLIILSGDQTCINRTVFSNRILVMFGLISYPLYLWHWPLLSFAQIIEGRAPTVRTTIILIATAIAFAWLSYRLVEKPIRHSRSGYIPIVLVVLMTICGMLGWLIFKYSGYPYRVPTSVQSFSNRSSDWRYPAPGMRKEIIDGISVLRVGGKGKQTIFYGDSNMEQYAPRIAKLLINSKDNQRGAIFLTRGATAPIQGVLRSGEKNETNSRSVEILANNLDVDRIVIAAAWPLYFNKDKAELGLGRDAPVYTIQGHDLTSEAGKNLAISHLSNQIRELTKMGKNVYIIGPTPGGREFGPDACMIHGRSILLSMNESDPNCQVDRTIITHRLAQSLAILKDVALKENVGIIDPVPLLCDNRECPVVIMKDIGHLRASFVRESLRYLDFSVNDSGTLR